MQGAAKNEWRQHWTLPLAASLGNSTTVLHIYSLGSFMVPLQAAFGWGRAEISVGTTVAAGVAVVSGPAVGFLMDRWGPRVIGLLGVAIMCAVYALLGSASGTIANWLALWCLIGFGTSWVQATIWTSAVASRFDASRGLAIAVTISGSGLAAAVLPALATWMIASFGWRTGFAALALVWAIVVLPFVFMFFRGAQDSRPVPVAGEPDPRDALAGLTMGEALRSPSFYKLAVAGMVFTIPVIGLLVHFVPVLQDRGLSALSAAGIAGLAGISSIAGRLGTGILLDRFRPERVAMIVFLLPIAAGFLLLLGSGPLALSAAAIIIGFSLGSELDVIIYLASRHFGLKNFGAVFSTMLIGLGVGSALGPVSAGAVFDHFGSYTNFILLIFPLVALGSLLLGSLGPAPAHAHTKAARR